MILGVDTEKKILAVEAYHASIVENVFEKFSRKVASKIPLYDEDPRGFKMFFDKYTNELYADLTANIKDGQLSLFQVVQDKMLKEIALISKLAKKKVATDFVRTVNERTKIAFDKFVTRSRDGLSLSDRVWNILELQKKTLDDYLKVGIEAGKSARTLARGMYGYLKSPTGDLHPGVGVYRSPFQNALRLTGSEINLAYNTADNAQRQESPFVIGVRVHLSNNHPENDICDYMKGDYPPTFNFVKWHPRCRCFSTNILAPEEYLKKWVQTGDAPPESLQIKGMPKQAESYLNQYPQNANNYFIKYNKEFYSNIKLK